MAYSAFWNVVDFPAGIVPFGFETGKKVSLYDDQGDMALKLAKKVNICTSTNTIYGSKADILLLLTSSALRSRWGLRLEFK